jgi:tetratricopeptide (TPR) repeat protein
VAVLLLVVVGCAPRALSGAPVAEANRLYEDGRFTEAAAQYQALVDGGAVDGTVYYNLGNAYFKAGDLGHAILNYRRAQRLIPRDPDVDANLQLARALTKDRLEAEGGGTPVSFVRRVLVEWVTLDEASALALGLWVVLCVLVVGAVLWRRGRTGLRHGILVVSTLLALSILSVGVQLYEERGQKPAVVVVQSVEAHSGPGTDYLTEFSLHAGAEVRVLEERGGWARIGLPGDLQGWVPNEAVRCV